MINGAGYIQTFCGTVACISLQESGAVLGEMCYFVIFMWLIVVTYHKQSAVSKVLREEDKDIRNGEETKVDEAKEPKPV